MNLYKFACKPLIALKLISLIWFKISYFIIENSNYSKYTKEGQNQNYQIIE